MLGTGSPEPACLAYLSSHFILGKVLMARAAGIPGGGNHGAFCPPHPALGRAEEGAGGGAVQEPSVGSAWRGIFYSPAQGKGQRAGDTGTSIGRDSAAGLAPSVRCPSVRPSRWRCQVM